MAKCLSYCNRLQTDVDSAKILWSKLGKGSWCRGLTCLPVTEEIAGSNPVGPASVLTPVICTEGKPDIRTKPLLRWFFDIVRTWNFRSPSIPLD